MEALLPDGFFDSLLRTGSRQLVALSLQHVYVFVLVLIRLSGLMSTSPIFGQASLPVRVRVMIVIALALMLTPVVQQTGSLNVGRFDLNRDGFLVNEEVPPHLHARLRAVAESLSLSEQSAVPVKAFAHRFQLPPTLSGLAETVLAEFSLGFLLGMGVMVLMSGLQLAGQMIDQQLGLEFGSVVNPDLPQGAAVSGQMLFIAGGCVLLTMPPVNGHLLILSALVETFDALPVGEAVFFSGAGMMLSELVHKSLLLAVQVAAPILAAMSLVSLSLGYLGHSVPQINQMVVGFPIRSFAGLIIFSASLSGSLRVLVDAVPGAILDIQQALVMSG